MKLKETDLPGIGKKFSIITSHNDKIDVIIYINGKRELFIFEKDDYDEPVANVILNEEEANQLGSILMGVYFKPETEETKECLLKNLVIEWIEVDENSPLVNHTLKDLQIRQKTGASVISIIRGDKTIINPSPDEVIKKGDTLVLVGSREQIEKFFKEFKVRN